MQREHLHLFPLSDQYRSAQALADIRRLLYIDELWTQALEGSPDVAREDVPSFQSLADEATQLFEVAVDHAQWLQDLVQGNADLFEQVWNQASDQVKLNETVKQEVQAKIEASGGFAAYLGENIAVLLRAAPTEREQIADRISRIQIGLPAQGDMRDETRCSLLGMSISYAAMGGVPGLAVHYYFAWRFRCFAP